MTITITPSPIRKSLRVECNPKRTFEVFTARMGAWWHPDHTLLKSPREAVILEPRAGGRWYERAVDGSEYNWGHVIVWEPPARIVLAWQLDGQWQFNPDLVTELEVRFVPDGEGATRVELEHRNIERFAEHAEAARAALDSPEGWSAGLARFAALANARD
jgi:uncharacterized protein YndB with AHSA1/START domain